MSDQATQADLTDTQFWNRFWGSNGATIGPSRGSVKDFVREEALTLLKRWVPPRSRWIEIGAANSTFLYDFPKRLHARLDGVDNAESAVRHTRTQLADLQIESRITQHDFRSPNTDEAHAYDGVISWGFVEHFAECVSVHEAICRYLKPNGIVISIVPNLTGLPGLLQQWCDRELFLRHNILTEATLAGSMAEAGLHVEFCEPVLPTNLAVVNPSRLPRPVATSLRAVFVGSGRALALERQLTGRRSRARAWQAPYLMGVGRWPGAGTKSVSIGTADE